MSEKRNTLYLKVITPERVLYEGEVSKYIVKVKGQVGEFSVWPNKSPITSSLGLGKIVIYLPDGKTKEATLFGGYALVDKFESVILTDVAEWPEEIDFERAEKAKQRAESRIADANFDYARASLALGKAIARMSFREQDKF